MPGNAPPRRTMTPLEWGMLLILSVVWGGSFFFNRVAVQELPVFTVVVSRVALAAIILTVILRLRGERLPTSGRVWAAFFGMGFLNNAVPFLLIVWGQQFIASGVASILNASTPLFTVLFAHFLTTDEKLSGGRLAGVLIGFAGVAVMIGPDAFRALGGNLAAQLACLGAAVSYAFAGIFGRRFRAMGVTPITTAAGQVIASSTMLLPVMLVVDRPWTLPLPSVAALGALVALAAVSTAFAYVLFFRILSTAGATNIVLVTFLVPVSAILLGVAFLGERLRPEHLAGMALIGAGLAAIDGRLWRRLNPRAARDG
ncbi:Permease of the drug/metabolite transporter (DMT) superfamily [Pseudoxanthobacter soli DSM 19599]|uniref:Permease of the drug/metabolite transporter (DMT) superfamily n=1 Tax=Pseudoxanthobacter soli DSM 19599 TaxID=1123029 RepID=A0A1M7ZMW9_9HYPH|nr:EamA family transporter [Pseudoxanthobacter soli]SHO66254.1 Permease of the drug/metabolite transporter (DMT) superfamily [Pseudoxanthobacter soli DSM 19599]